MKKTVLSLLLCVSLLVCAFVPVGPVLAETKTTATITVNYVYEKNGAMVAQPYSATVPKNEPFEKRIAVPRLINYSITAESAADALAKGFSLDTESGVLEVHLDTVTADISVVLYYEAGTAVYHVRHMVEKLGSDEYELKKTVELTGDIDAYTEAVADPMEGFAARVEKAPIAADGTTEVTIWYDRLAYTVVFDPNGGIGASDPIYAEYGDTFAPEYVKEPTRAGYIFNGWTPAVEYTITKNVTYTAQWTCKTDSADYTVVIWGQNANDDDYAYLDAKEAWGRPGDTVTWSEDILICQEAHVHGPDCYTLTCEKKEHSHDAACIGCDSAEHIHTAECCEKEEHRHSDACCAKPGHTHTAGICYIKDSATPCNGTHLVLYPQEGETYTHIRGGGMEGRTCVYHNGVWYEYGTTPTCGIEEHTHGDGSCTCSQEEHTHGDGNCAYICGQEEHRHGDSCYTCGLEEHIHTGLTGSCYQLTCGLEEHTVHTAACYMGSLHPGSDLWVYEKSDEVTIEADGSTVLNVYFRRKEFTLTFRDNNRTVYTLTQRWGADIRSHWPIPGYERGERWDPNGDRSHSSSTYRNVLVHIDIMPAESFYLVADSGGSRPTYTMNYYVEALDGTGEVSYGGKYFTKAFTVKAKYNYVTEAEDFFPLEGYTKWRSDPAFSGNQIELTGGGTVNFYYTRNEYHLKFFSGSNSTPVRSDSVQYQENLGPYDWTPADRPAAVESDAVFAGWYLNPQCTGQPYDFAAHNMPPNDLALYAKWANALYTVRTFTDSTLQALYTYAGYDGVQEGIVKYTKAAPPDDPAQTGLAFVGWFYTGEDGTEKPFSFTMPITRNYDLYPKFSDKKMVKYTIHYYIEGTSTKVASDEKGEARIGSTVTAAAKMGDELDLVTDGTVYFPTNTSTSVVLDKNQNDIIFYYKPMAQTAYTVYYQDGQGRNLLEPVTKYSGQSTVTEDYVPIDGYAPRNYQLSLDLSANPEENILVFVYDPTNTALTITKAGAQNPDTNQSFLFHIQGADENTKAVDVTVAIHGNGSITVTDLPVGQYTVTELTDWSWRYEPQDGKDARQITLTAAGDDMLTFENERKQEKWLDGDNYRVNRFTGGQN